MTAISTQVERSLAQTVAVTGRWKAARARPAALCQALSLLDFLARGVFHVWRNHRYLTLLKLANMALVNIQFKLKTERVIGRPYSIVVTAPVDPTRATVNKPVAMPASPTKCSTSPVTSQWPNSFARSKVQRR